MTARSPLVGRQRELELLDRLAGPSFEPDGGRRTVVLVGAPGVGITHLVHTWTRLAGDRATVLAFDGRGGRGDIPGARRLVHRSIARLAVRDPETARLLLAEHVEGIVAESSGRPVLVVLDHLDDASAASLLLLDAIASLDHKLPVATLAVAHGAVDDDTIVFASDGAARLVESFASHGPTPPVTVDRLRDDVLASIVTTRSPSIAAGRLASIVERSGGNPWIALAMADAPGERAVPDDVAEWVRELADRDPARAVVAACAATRVPVPLNAVAADNDARAAVERSPLLEVRDNTRGARVESVQVAAPALADALRAATPVAAGRAAVAELSRSIERWMGAPLPDRAPDQSAVTWAGHERHRLHPNGLEVLADCLRAVDPARALIAARTHARVHELELRPLDACAARLDAIALARNVGVKDELVSMREAFVAVREVNDLPRAGILLRPIERIARAAGDTEAHVHALLERCWIELGSGARDDLKRDLDRIGDDVGWAERARGFLAFAAGDDAAALEHARTARRLATQAEDLVLDLQAAELEAMCTETCKSGAAAADVYAAAGRTARRIASWRRACSLAGNELGMLVRTGAAPAAVERASGYIEEARRSGRRGQECDLLVMRAFAQLAAGDVNASTTTMLEAMDTLADAATTPFSRMVAACIDLRLSLERDVLPAAAEALERAKLLVAEYDDAYMRAFLAAQSLRLLLDEPDRAAELHAAVEQLVGADASIAGEGALALARADLLGHGGTAARSGTARLLNALRNENSGAAAGQVYAERAVEECAAIAARDGTRLSAVAASWRRDGYLLDALELEVAAAVAGITAGGELPPTTEHLAMLRRSARAIGAARLEGIINARLRQRGVAAPAPSRPRAGARFTTRELQIAQLVRDDRTNADIAARLDIAPATVARILANVYRRYGLSGRGALVRILDEADV